jgi:hypothetical protein
MTRAALAYLPIPASPRPADVRLQPRRKHHNPTSTRLSTCFSRHPRLQPKPRLGVKNWTPQNAPGLSLKTHVNPPGITPVAEDAVVGCSVAAERAYGPTFKGLLSDIRAADFSTPKNGAVFWTGFREGNQARAMQWASQNGKLTIETTPGGRWLESLDLYGPNSRVSIAEADNLWRAASAQYARGASGQINAFTVGAPLNRANAYYGVELPKLTASPNVVQPIIVR